HGSDREVDARGDDHDELAQGEDRVDRGLPQDVEQVVEGEEVRRGQGEDEAEEEQAQERSELLPPGRAAHDARVAAAPVARARMSAGVASARVSSPTRRPWRITRMRSHSASSSGISEEATRSAIPDAASARRWRWISALADTSTPRVGSSSSRTRVSRSQRPRTTFCWLPPESVRTGAS